MSNPTSVNADGNLKVAWVPDGGIATAAAPTQSELRAGSVVDLSCYLTGDGMSPSADESVVTDDRLCSTQTFEGPGRVTDRLEVKYVYQGQAMTAADNKAFATLLHLSKGFVVTRWGADHETDWTTGDVVDVYPAQCGRQMKQAPEANGKLKVGQRIFITDTLQENVAVV